MFWNSEGRFLLEDPKTITVTQGDGKQARITLFSGDEDLLKALAFNVIREAAETDYTVTIVDAHNGKRWSAAYRSRAAN
jgi:hypothetical protein